MLAVASLTGCTMGPDFHKPVVETPHDYRFAGPEAEARVNLQWWELFDDPVLNSLVITALNDNKDVRIAASRIAG